MNLTKMSKAFKRGLLFLGGFVLVYYVLILIIIPIGQSLIAVIFPDRNPPTVSYGKLDPLQFVEKPISGTPTFQLNTQNGRLPSNIPNRIKVYKFRPVSFSYIAGKAARQDAEYLGYTDADLITDLKGDTYKWRSLQTGGTLEIQINTRAITLDTNFAGKDVYFPKGSTDKISAVQNATSMFTKLGRFNDTLYPTGYNQVYLGRFYGNRVLITENPADAQVARVDLFRKIDGYKILGSDPKKGLLHAFVGKVERDKLTPASFPKIRANYWELESTSTATYPIIPVSQAWQAIKGGKGVITNVTPKDANPFEDYQQAAIGEILVNDIYLAYYETPEYQTYLQPIYVFDGNYTAAGTQGGSITLYFPAITGEYTNSVGTTTIPAK